MNLLKNVIIAGLVGTALVTGAPRTASAAGNTATSALARVDDSALQSQIAASLKKSSLAPRDIDVDVKQSVVTLTGKVRTTAEKTSAGRLAKVSGVTRVNNLIVVDPKMDQSKIDTAADKTKSGTAKAVDTAADKTKTGTAKAVDATQSAAEKTKDAIQKGLGKSEDGVAKAADKTSEAVAKTADTLSDTSVTTRVKTGFSGEPSLKNVAIDVQTTDHVVTLRGTVASDETKTTAGKVAGAIEGVTRVVNQLVVK